MCQNPLNCSGGCGYGSSALTLHWSCLVLADLALTLPWTCHDLVLTRDVRRRGIFWKIDPRRRLLSMIPPGDYIWGSALLCKQGINCNNSIYPSFEGLNKRSKNIFQFLCRAWFDFAQPLIMLLVPLFTTQYNNALDSDWIDSEDDF